MALRFKETYDESYTLNYFSEYQFQTKVAIERIGGIRIHSKNLQLLSLKIPMAKCSNAKNNTAKPTRGVSIFLLIQKQTNVYYMKMEILKRWKVTMEHQSIAVSLWIFCRRLGRAILII